MSYVPDSLNGLTKARVVGHRGDVENFIKYMHISWHCLSLEEIKESELTSTSSIPFTFARPSFPVEWDPEPTRVFRRTKTSFLSD